MSLQLIANHDGASHRFPLADGVSRVGGDIDCEVRLAHPEAPAVGLTVEVNGTSVVVRNRCEYEIYVGSDPLPPQQLSAWTPGDDVLLSRSISLQLQREAPAGSELDEPQAEKESPFSQRRIAMMAVIALCAAIGVQQTLTDPAEPAREITVGFNDLRSDIEHQISIENDARGRRDWSEALRLLQEARYLELRLSDRRSGTVVEAYQRLLDAQVLRGDETQDENSLAAQLELFATAKKDAFDD